MWNSSHVGVCAAAIALGLVGLGCASGSEVHLIPAGYTGPVVIVYEEGKGGSSPSQDGSSFVYEIPPDGVLRVDKPIPKGRINMKFYYVLADMERTELPFQADGRSIQAFGTVVGSTGAPGREIQWKAYVVGVPGERDDWLRLRNSAIDLALGRESPP
jgi:hypothetical protein